MHKHHGAERVVRPAAPSAQSQMNVTPLIDLLLVLLVIFMVALPITQKGLDVDVPRDVQAPAQPSVGTFQIVVEVSATRRLTLNRKEVALRDLRRELRQVYQDRDDKTLFIIGAPTLRYADIVEVVDAARGAGVERVGIITERMRRGAMRSG